MRLKGRRHGWPLSEPKMQAHLREAFIERLKLHALRFDDEGRPFGNDRQEHNALVQNLVVPEIVQQRIRSRFPACRRIDRRSLHPWQLSGVNLPMNCCSGGLSSLAGC